MRQMNNYLTRLKQKRKHYGNKVAELLKFKGERLVANAWYTHNVVQKLV